MNKNPEERKLLMVVTYLSKVEKEKLRHKAFLSGVTLSKFIKQTLQENGVFDEGGDK